MYLNYVTVTETKTLCARHAGHVCQYANGYATYWIPYMFSRVFRMTFSDVGTYEFWLRYVLRPLVVSFTSVPTTPNLHHAC